MAIEWNTFPIKSLYDGLYDGPHATPKRSDDGPVFLGIKNVTDDGRLDLTEIRHIAEDDYSAWTRRVEPRQDDLVFTYEATLNRYAVIPPGFRGCLGRRMALIRTNPLKTDVRFLLYYFFTDEWRAVIQRNILTGATVDRIPLTAFPDFPVRVPPLPIQRRIARILSAYDQLIENNHRSIALLESMARVLYREWFVHFRFPGHQSVSRVPSPVGEIPQGWEAVPFERLLASMTGGDWGSEQPEDPHTKAVIVVRGTDFDEVAYGGQLRAPVRHIKPSSFASRGLKVGDVIIENSINAKSRSVGTTLLVDHHVLNRLGKDAIAASFCKVLRPHDQRLSPLIHLRARHLREDARIEYYQNVAANGIANFQAQKFAREEHLVLPADDDQLAKLIEPIGALFQSVGVIASRLANLRLTRDLLLPRLFSGQIDVEAMAA